MKPLLVCLLFLLAAATKAQNLVPNSSFEDTCECGKKGELCDPAGWLYIKKGATNGYAHMVDGIAAHSGSRKLSFTVGKKFDKQRTYWETTLLKPLQKGARYKLTLYIHGWDDPPNLNDMGIWFVDSLFFVREDTLLQPAKYIDILHARIGQEKNGWFKVEQEIVPERNYRYMLVGNFSPKDYQQVARGRFSRSYYICDFIDDIKIEPVPKEDCPDCPRLKDSIYTISQQLLVRQRSAAPEREKIATTGAGTVTKTIDTLELPNFLFASNSSKMSDSNSLAQYNSIFGDARVQKVVVAGYTDTVGTREYNAALAERRAREVAEQIERRFNINPAIVESAGRGVSKKYAEMEKNRRVEIYIYR